MIPVDRDEGLVYDDLAILGLKAGKGSKVSMAQYLKLAERIAATIGDEAHGRVLVSDEYTALATANRELFDLIDWLKSPDRDPEVCYDNQIDLLNLKRNRAKAALQARWFPDSPFTEVKLGYDKSTL